MARTKLNQRSDDRVDVPMGATGGRPPSKALIAVLVLSILTAIWAAAMLTPFGRVGYLYVFAYSEYYLGVVTLVALSITIMVGLVSTDRLVLSIRQRVLLQSAHRTTGVIAVVALVAHVWTKYVGEYIGLIDIFIPFLAPFNRVLIGMGTLSGWVMMLVMWTGIARAKFIGRGKPWMWRSIHAVSYLMWPIALVHGLAAGRDAATWVIVSYVVCVLGVLAGLAVRLSVSLNRRKDFSSTATGAMKPVGAVVPTQAQAQAQAAPAPRKRASRRPEPAPAPERFVPSSRPTSGASPRASIEPVSGGGRISSAPISGAPADVTPYARYMDEPRGRYDDETQVGAIRPQRRERFDEPTGRMSRRALELEAPEEEPRGRRRAPEPPRPRRYAEEDDYAPRRRAEEPRYEEPRYEEPRGRRYADEDEDYYAPRQRRAADVDRADSGRHSRSEFVDLSGPQGGWGADDYVEPDETPTLVDMASRRARRQSQPDGGRMPAGRGARRGGGGRGYGDEEDAQYWRQLRGEAQ